MTTYNYMIEMQDMCFRISQACKAMNKRGTQDVYAACERGFGEMAKELNCEEAGRAINQDQLDIYVCTQNFCKEQEKKAAACIKGQIEDLFGGEHPQENYIDKVFKDKEYRQSVAAAAKEQESVND